MKLLVATLLDEVFANINAHRGVVHDALLGVTVLVLFLRLQLRLHALEQPLVHLILVRKVLSLLLLLNRGTCISSLDHLGLQIEAVFASFRVVHVSLQVKVHFLGVATGCVECLLPGRLNLLPKRLIFLFVVVLKPELLTVRYKRIDKKQHALVRPHNSPLNSFSFQHFPATFLFSLGALSYLLQLDGPLLVLDALLLTAHLLGVRHAR